MALKYAGYVTALAKARLGRMNHAHHAKAKVSF
jgi:hypothetical protein